ncbi:MAG: LemA family protein [Bacteroidales bacterium]|nr:LemA family protein [Bacteroidales bacterium]MBR5055961.1 LemA family protein [Bacteroidales bacterium]
MTLIIIIAILAVLVFWGIGVQRKLVNQEELCKNAMSQIGVQQNSRWDALTALVELVKSYNEHEYNTLKDVISMRQPLNRNSTAAEVNAQENAINDAMRQINVAVERYPELKANENYAKAMDSVNLYENQVRMSRMVYNDTVTKYNKIVRQFPESIVAGLLKFGIKEYLAEPQGKTDMPSMKI